MHVARGFNLGDGLPSTMYTVQSTQQMNNDSKCLFVYRCLMCKGRGPSQNNIVCIIYCQNVNFRQNKNVNINFQASPMCGY